MSARKVKGCMDAWYRCLLKKLHLFLEKRIESSDRDVQDIDNGLSRREKQPLRFTIRKHIYLALAFSLLGSLAIGIALIITMYMMSKNFENLQSASEFSQKVAESMQHTKDYFLTGSGVGSAVNAITEAKKVLLKNYSNFINETQKGDEIENVEEYERLLLDLKDMDGEPSELSFIRKKEKISRKLQSYGRKITIFATSLSKNENVTMEKTLILFNVVHIYALVFLFLLALFLVHLLGKRMLRSIKELNNYTGLIASGNFSSSLPSKRLSDEFSDLTASINQMMKELDRQQNVLAQSHKLRAVGTLTAGIAHELNNPINNIMLTAHMLLEDYFDLCDDERVDMVRDLIEEAGRARLIVRNLLDFARESESIMEPICIGKVVKETMKIASSQIKLAGVYVDKNIAPNLPRIHGDRHQLEQVFLNLILNAMDVTMKGGRISIDVEHDLDEPSFVCVKVIDYGKGIPDHVLQHIFDPFFTTKSKGKGTGLGLSVSQGIIAKHGGHISVNTKISRGTTFIVKLPITTIPADLGVCEENYSVAVSAIKR